MQSKSFYMAMTPEGDPTLPEEALRELSSRRNGNSSLPEVPALIPEPDSAAQTNSQVIKASSIGKGRVFERKIILSGNGGREITVIGNSNEFSKTY